MSDIQQLVDQLGELSKISKDLYGQYKAIEDQKVEVRAALNAALKDTGLRSAKTENFTASVAVKKSVAIKDDSSVMGWIKTNIPNELDHYVGLKATPVKTMAMSLLKDTGEVIPGTELVETETLSIKANKKEK